MPRVRKYAPPRENDGLFAYVVETSRWAGSRKEYAIVWEKSLAEANGKHGWTREDYTSKRLRRATPEDLKAYEKKG